MLEVTLSALMGFGLLPVLEVQGGEQFTLAVDVDLVVFNVTVTDRDGHLVSGLELENFRVFEDGVDQEIALFRPERAPATIGLIIDGSGSMRERRGEVAEAALAFADASNPEDEIFVVSFNENVFVRQPDPGDGAQLRNAVLQTPPPGLTALHDAVVTGLENLRTGTRDRKALVILSDGGDNASRRTLDDVLESLRRSSATVYAIDIFDPYSRDRNPEVLRQIAGVSGGQAYALNSISDLERIWSDVARGIRAQYTLGYYSTNPADDGGFRQVQISASRDGELLNVRTREGYLAPENED